MKSRTIAVRLWTASCCALSVACFGSQNGGSPDGSVVTPPGDGGGTADADVGSPGSDGGLDGAQGDATSSGGGGDSGDAASSEGGVEAGPDGAAPFTHCDPKTAVDLTAGVNGAQSINAAAYGDKQVALWMLDYNVSPDGQNHFNARSASLGAWGGVVDLGVGNYYPSPFLVTDGAGRGFAQYTGSATVRSVYDFTSQTFAAPTTFPAPANGGTGSDSALVGLAAGGAVSLYTSYASATTVYADKWNPSSGQWEATGLAVPAASPAGLIAQANPGTSRVGYVFYVYSGPAPVLNLGAYDGAAWVTDTMTPSTEGGVAGAFTVGVFASGDLLVAYYSPSDGSPVAARYHVTGKTWDPAVVLDPGGGPVAALQVAVDASDRATVVWQRGSANGYARRNLGSGWAPATDLGPATSSAHGYRLALDASSNVYILAASTAAGDLVLWRADAASATFAAPFPTGLATVAGALSGNFSLDRGTALTFDAAGHPLVYAALIPPVKDGGIGFSLYTTKCH